MYHSMSGLFLSGLLLSGHVACCMLRAWRLAWLAADTRLSPLTLVVHSSAVEEPFGNGTWAIVCHQLASPSGWASGKRELAMDSGTAVE